MKEDERAGIASAVWFDLRQALRSVRRMPAFFVLAGATLAIGFSAHFAAFTIVDRLLLAAPVGVAQPEALRRIHIERADIRGGRFLWYQNPYVVYQDLRRLLRPDMRLGAYRISRTSLGAGAEARMVSVAFADRDYFSVLGASAAFGRVLTPDDDPAPAGTPVIVLSDGFWRGAFGADRGVLGRTVRLGAKAFTVVGVMPPAFVGDSLETIDAWAPLHAGAYEMSPTWLTSRTVVRSLTVLLRLPPGVSDQAAAEEIKSAYQATIKGTAEADPTARAVLAPISASRQQNGALTESARIALWLQGVAVLVLFVAIANVVNLQLSRAVQRRREMAVRLALGAAPARIVAQLGAEAALVVGGGALAGIALTRLTAAAMQQLMAPGSAAAIDTGRFTLLALGSSLVAAIVCTAAASIHLRGERISDRLRTGRGGDGFTRPTFRQALLVAQVAVSALLLVGAGLFVRSMDRLDRLQFGMDQERVHGDHGPAAQCRLQPRRDRSLLRSRAGRAPRGPGRRARERRPVGAVPAVAVGADRLAGDGPAPGERTDLPDLLRGHAGSLRHGRRPHPARARVPRFRSRRRAAGDHRRAGARREAVAGSGSDRQVPHSREAGRSVPRSRRRGLEYAPFRPHRRRRDALLRAAGAARGADPAPGAARADQPAIHTTSLRRSAPRSSASRRIFRFRKCSPCASWRSRRSGSGASAARCSPRAGPSRCS